MILMYLVYTSLDEAFSFPTSKGLLDTDKIKHIINTSAQKDDFLWSGYFECMLNQNNYTMPQAMCKTYIIMVAGATLAMHPASYAYVASMGREKYSLAITVYMGC